MTTRYRVEILLQRDLTADTKGEAFAEGVRIANLLEIPKPKTLGERPLQVVDVSAYKLTAKGEKDYGDV